MDLSRLKIILAEKKRTSKWLARKNSTVIVKDHISYLMSLNPEDEEIGTYVSDGKIYYLGLQVNDIRQFSSIDEIIEILNSMEYNIIQD